MKAFLVLAVSIVLVSTLFCPLVRAAPPIPEEFQIINPDPSLPKELSAFFGRYEGINGPVKLFVIVAKIDKEKATLYIYREGLLVRGTYLWEPVEAEVFKEGGKYQLWYRTSYTGDIGGSIVATLEGKYLNLKSHSGLVRLSRVP